MKWTERYYDPELAALLNRREGLAEMLRGYAPDEVSDDGLTLPLDALAIRRELGKLDRQIRAYHQPNRVVAK